MIRLRRVVIGLVLAAGVVALAAGPHPITVTYFNQTGGRELEVGYSGPDMEQQEVPSAILAHTGTGQAAADTPVTPLPRQLAWQDMEFIAFVHFGMNTFTDREWGDGQEDPKLFNPTELDARQWVSVFKAAGMKQVIITAKHHDGFCLWPSKYTEHSVKNSPWRDGKGDVVRELADACKEAGLKLGVYLSPWDRHEPTYGDSPRYSEHYRNQLTELLSNYGPIYEVWFDGACGEGPNGKKQVYDWPSYIEVVRKLAPDAVIFSDGGPDVRWVGNESGFAGATNWSMLRRDQFYPGAPNADQLAQGHEDGTHWVPAECDVSIRPGWFYHAKEDDKVKTVQQLVDIYYNSVGRNGLLLLNVPADCRGLIHEHDAARLSEFRAILDETFKADLAAGKTATANVQADKPEHSPGKAVDGDRATYWTTGQDVKAAALTIDLGQPTTFDRILIQEAIQLGQHVKSFTVEAWDGKDWQSIAAGTTIGHKRLLRVKESTTPRVRLVIRDARAAPAISEFGLFQASPRERSAP